jgi:hypothetical protein
MIDKQNLDPMTHYAVVKNGKIVNVILWDGKSVFHADGVLVSIGAISPEPGINWDYIDGKFIDNRPVIDEVGAPAQGEEL